MALTAEDLQSIKNIVDESVTTAVHDSRVGIVAELSAKIDRSADRVIDEMTGVVRETQDVIAEVMEDKFAVVDTRLDGIDDRLDGIDKRLSRGQRDAHL